MSETQKCETCGKSGEKGTDWHNYRHPLRMLGGSVTLADTFGHKLPDGTRVPPPPGAQVEMNPMQSAWPFDPVLRQALMDKGVLEPEDLERAEKKIRATTAQFGAMT